MQTFQKHFTTILLFYAKFGGKQSELWAIGKQRIDWMYRKCKHRFLFIAVDNNASYSYGYGRSERFRGTFPDSTPGRFKQHIKNTT